MLPVLSMCNEALEDLIPLDRLDPVSIPGVFVMLDYDIGGESAIENPLIVWLGTNHSRPTLLNWITGMSAYTGYHA
jgi:hypothetical protein